MIIVYYLFLNSFIVVFTLCVIYYFIITIYVIFLLRIIYKYLVYYSRFDEYGIKMKNLTVEQLIELDETSPKLTKVHINFNFYFYINYSCMLKSIQTPF